MLLTVKKQIEETLEVKTPAYYRSLTGYHFINKSGQLTTINDRMISMWEPKDGKYYNDDVERIVSNGKPIEKEEFENRKAEFLAKVESVTAIEI